MHSCVPVGMSLTNVLTWGNLVSAALLLREVYDLVSSPHSFISIPSLTVELISRMATLPQHLSYFSAPSLITAGKNHQQSWSTSLQIHVTWTLMTIFKSLLSSSSTSHSQRTMIPTGWARGVYLFIYSLIDLFWFQVFI